MFVRIKSTSNSPRKTVQIVESIRKGSKVSQKIIRYIGVAKNNEELEDLKLLAESIKIKLEADNQQLLISPEELVEMNLKAKPEKAKETEEDYKVNLKNMIEEQRVVSGIHDIHGKLFDELDCKSIIKNPARNTSAVKYFKNIVLARIANPKSKMATVDMLEENFGVSLNLDKVYSMMDKLDDNAIEKLNNLMYGHTECLFQGKIDVVFFDCTTLYFESFREDSLRKKGYSKDLKFNETQVLLALMVTKEGLPVGYKVFSGNTYEGHTLIPAIKELKEKYRLDKVVLVADAGMLNKDNLAELDNPEGKQIEYIVGARLKNITNDLQRQILDRHNYRKISEGYTIGEFKYKEKRLIVSYSRERAKKDARDRLEAVEKLQKKLEKHKNPKEYLSNYGYKKYLEVKGESTFELDETKIEADSRWDGLQGIVTNSRNLSAKDLIIQYRYLWEVEEAFRVNKHDLKVRPIFHWKPSRVRAHMAIAFTAYSLVKHLEHRVRLQYKKLSPERIRKLLINVQTSILFNTKKKIRYGLPSRITTDAQKIYKILCANHSRTPYIIQKM